MTDKEALKIALDALELTHPRFGIATEKYKQAITALKERLEDPMREVQRLGQEIEQEPVAWMSASRFGELQKGVSVITTLTKQRAFEDDVAIHTHPPQRTEQEPVAWISPSGALYRTRYHAVANAEQSLTPLYLHPPQRTEQKPVGRFTGKFTVDAHDRMLCEVVCSNAIPTAGAALYDAPPQRTEPICPECKAEVLYECVACSSNNYPQKENKHD